MIRVLGNQNHRVSTPPQIVFVAVILVSGRNVSQTWCFFSLEPSMNKSLVHCVRALQSSIERPLATNQWSSHEFSAYPFGSRNLLIRERGHGWNRRRAGGADGRGEGGENSSNSTDCFFPIDFISSWNIFVPWETVQIVSRTHMQNQSTKLNIGVQNGYSLNDIVINSVLSFSNAFVNLSRGNIFTFSSPA